MSDSTPICRCRVLYLGSAVPRQSKDGLQGIQEPLRSLYPSEGALGAKGIDSWLSVWSNGILLENVDENLKQITRFFPIESLHYCAAVRQVLIPERGNTKPEPKFLPLDSPFARMPRAQHPPLFAAILRRTTGIKVLECHVFICKREAAANALVRCCFHAYADNSYARQLETGSSGDGGSSVYGTLKSAFGSKSNGDLTAIGQNNGNHHHISTSSSQGGWRSRAGSTTTLNSVGRQSNGHTFNGTNGLSLNSGVSNTSAAEGYTSVKNLYGSSADLIVAVDDCETSIYNGDENHKVWSGSQDQLDTIAMESPYEVFPGNTSTMGRPVRARQISTPIDVPPPPTRDETDKKRKNKNILKTHGSQSLSGTLIRPKPILPGAFQRAGIYAGVQGGGIYGPVFGSGTFPSPQGSRTYHTISHRSLHSGSHFSHPGIPPPTQMMLSPHMGTPKQMPIMLSQQYTTLQTNLTTKKKKKDKKSSGIPVGLPIVPPVYAFHHTMSATPQPQTSFTQSLFGETRPLAITNRNIAVSMGNGLDDVLNSGTESPGGTGIYRRKGHLNERAFSYSIRQEHRSRSHGSLASLQFNPPDMKKEREIAQMVAGLDLNGEDEIETERKHILSSNAGGTGPQSSHAIYGNGSTTAIYGNDTVPNSIGKPRR